MNQNMAALNRANQVRVQRAIIKQGVKDGELDASDVIRNERGGITVMDVLKAIPRFGPARAESLMNEQQLPHGATLGGDRTSIHIPITDRQRERLAERVGWIQAGYGKLRIAA